MKTNITAYYRLSQHDRSYITSCAANCRTIQSPPVGHSLTCCGGNRQGCGQRIKTRTGRGLRHDQRVCSLQSMVKRAQFVESINTLTRRTARAPLSPWGKSNSNVRGIPRGQFASRPCLYLSSLATYHNSREV